MINFTSKPRYALDDLIRLVHALRAPGGCPLDAELTHLSIRRNFLVEAYEACEALDCDDAAMLREELGDVLLQVVLNSCIGAEHRALNVPGEKELSGMGVSYCASCDGAFFKDKTVAVIGGGDVAVEDAIFLARTCKKVYVIHRRDELRAAGVLQDALLALPNVEMVWDTVVDSIEGNEMVSSVKVTNKKTGEAGVITVDGVFIAVGIVPVSALIAGTVETDEAGYIKAGEDGVTSVPGVFAAGDVRTKQLRQIITAAADGANCVTSVEKYLISH